MIDKKNYKETLLSIPLFSELSSGQLDKVTAISELKHLTKNEILFLEGDFYKGFYIQLEGAVKIYKTSSDGKEAVVHLIQPFSVYADIPLFEGRNYPTSSQALDKGLALFIPKEGFINLIKENHDVSLKMLAGFAKRLKSMVIQIDDLQNKEVKNRLAKYLLNEINQNETLNLPEPLVKLNVPKSTIASYLGTITETLSRTFNKLQTEKIIRVDGKKIFVSNVNKLKELAE